MAFKVLFTLCLCLGLSTAQQLPNYYSGHFNIPNAPIPSPGSYQGQPAPVAHSAPQYAQAPQYAAAAPVARPAAPVQTAPMNYGWQVQHQSPQPQPQPAPVAAPQPSYAQQPQYTQAAPAVPQYAPPQAQPQQYQQYARSVPAQPQLAQPQQAYQTATSPISPALARPASVHYASVGENLAGDYKFGYRTGDGNSFREESRLPDGTVQGQYGFVDADGKQRVVKYSAGINGFQVLNENGNPAAPQSAPVAHRPVPQQAAAAPVSALPALPQWAQHSVNQAVPAPPQPKQAPAQYGAQPQPNWG